MGCTNCKEKKKTRLELYNSTNNSDTKLIVFLIIWSGFAIYGIITFLKLFI